MGSVHQGPTNRKGNEAAVARADLARALRRVVETEVDAEATFGEREVAALDAADEAIRLYCEGELRRIAERHGDDVLINGVHCRCSHQSSEVVYHSLCGPLRVGRARYREVGVRNGPTYVALELEAGLVEGATPALARSIALDRGLMHWSIPPRPSTVTCPVARR